ncbi:MAG: CPBP family intramembrane glutamic endopeptidase [Acidimicrobiales bacterium]
MKSSAPRTRDATTDSPSTAKGSVLVFVVSVLALGWLGPVLDRATGSEVGNGPGTILWIMLPAGTALLLRLRRDGWSDAGFEPSYRSARPWYRLAELFYPALIAVVIVSGLATDRLNLVDGDNVAGRLILLLLAGLIPSTITAILEEFGWRGFLVPRLQAAGVGRWSNHLIVGLVWGAWHLPYLSAFWDFTDESLLTLAPRFLIATVVAAVLYGEIRLATNSVWPAVVMHATANIVAAPFVSGEITTFAEPFPWLYSPSVDGGLMLALTAVVASIVVVISTTSRRGPATERASGPADRKPVRAEAATEPKGETNATHNQHQP